jgi:hypothetical protein
MSDAVKVGMLVRVYNQEHIWHNEIGIIRALGNGFSRVELLDKLVWMPNHWLTEVADRLDTKGESNDRV